MNVWRAGLLAPLIASPLAWHAARAHADGGSPTGSPPTAPLRAADADHHAELLRLMRAIELRLGEIDDLLADASAGDDPEPTPAQRLHATRSAGSAVLEDIARILDLECDCPSGSGGAGGT